MKKLTYLAVLTAALSLAPAAFAYDSTGCGLGSIIWKGQKGPAPQILAATTNGSFGTQTFGITSGSMGCDPNGTITGGTGKVLFVFLENNMDQYALDSSRGEGETLQTIAGILGVSEEKVAQVSKDNFNVLFPDQNVEVLHVAQTLMEMLKA
jgi:hypothetical protein